MTANRPLSRLRRAPLAAFAAAGLLAPALGGCGVTGGLERPPPLFGEPMTDAVVPGQNGAVDPVELTEPRTGRVGPPELTAAPEYIPDEEDVRRAVESDDLIGGADPEDDDRFIEGADGDE